MGKLQFNQYLPAIIVSFCLCLAPVQVMAFDIYDDNHVPVTPPQNNPKIIDIYNKDGTVKLKTGTGGNNPVIYKDSKIANKNGDVLLKRTAVALGTGAAVATVAVWGSAAVTVLAAGLTVYQVYNVLNDVLSGEPEFTVIEDGRVLKSNRYLWYSLDFPSSGSCDGRACFSSKDELISPFISYFGGKGKFLRWEFSSLTHEFMIIDGLYGDYGNIYTGHAYKLDNPNVTSEPATFDDIYEAIKNKQITMTPELEKMLAEALKRPEVWDKLNPAPLPDQYYDENGKAIPTGVEHPYGKPKTSVTTKTDSKGRIIEKTETETQPTIYVDPETGRATFGEKSTTTVTQYDPETGAAVSSNTSTTVATDSKPEEKLEKDDPSLICKLLPNILACQELDTPPEQQIPKETKTVTLQEADLGFGGGSCPADAVVTLSGKQYTIVEWSKICPFLTSDVKPLVLLLSAFISMMIIFRSSNESGGGVV